MALAGDPSSSAAPQKVGRYLVFDAIASGGMATVHLGRLLGDAGFTRTVVIKRLHAHLAGEAEIRGMFVDEARLTSRVRHPNVVKILDVEVIDGELFLVMEYVHGENLARLIEPPGSARVAAPPPIASAIAVAALHGLHAAHTARHTDGRPLDLVHRDVSPGNVLVGADGVPRLLDFGVARASFRVHETRNAALKGKLSYLAPELLRGEVATPAVDVYAVGVVLWEMLTGRKLFAGDDAAVAEQILTGYVQPPSRYAPGLPDALDDAVVRALRTTPKGRFESAAQMARALEDALPLASDHEIAAWVAERAAPSLASKAAQVVRVERYVEPPRPTLPDSPRAFETAPAVVAPGLDKPPTPPSPRRSATLVWIAAALTTALLTLSFFQAPAPSAPPPMPTPARVPAPPPDPAPPTDPPPRPPATSSTPPEPPPEPSAVSPSAASPPPRPSPHPARPGCAKPYLVDSKGTVHWKAECL